VRSIERQRDVEAVVLAALIDAHPDELTEAAVRRELTAVENTPERVAAIGEAVEGLVEVGLVARDGDLLRLTPPALRAGELELGI
jgi:hypothetical protein